MNDTPHADEPAVTIPSTCGDCVYCQPGPNTHQDVLSRVCYRNPPTAIGAVTKQGLAIVSIRPEIRTDTFACGEFDSGDDELETVTQS